MTIANPSSFWEEARYQRVCARCGKATPFHAHHVVDKQLLRTRCGLSGDDLYDTRNAMRLCAGLDTDQCHMQFENGRVDIELKKLSDDNIAYAFEKLGRYAHDYLHRKYLGPDPRVERQLVELEAAVA